MSDCQLTLLLHGGPIVEVLTKMTGWPRVLSLLELRKTDNKHYRQLCSTVLRENRSAISESVERKFAHAQFEHARVIIW